MRVISKLHANISVFLIVVNCTKVSIVHTTQLTYSHYYIWLKSPTKVCHEKVKIDFFVEKQFKILEKNQNVPDDRRYSDA